MKIGIETECLHLWFQNKKINLFEFIELASNIGFDGIVINMVGKRNQIKDLGALESRDEGYLAELKSWLDAKNMFVELDTRGLEFSHMSGILNIARLLGADIVRSFVMSGKNYSVFNTGGSFDSVIFSRAAADIRPLLPLLEEYGVRLAIENHECETSEEILRLLETVDSPRVGVCFDLGNSMMAWEDPIRAAENLAPHTITTHFKDHIITLDENAGEYVVCGTALGSGNIDIPKIGKILAERSGLTRFNLEMCHPYASAFKRPKGTGGVAEVGAGSFAIKPPPIPYSICQPLDYYNFTGKELVELMQLQMEDMKKSYRFLRNLANTI